MTVPRWDAKTASRRFPGEPAPPTRPPMPPRRKALWAAIATLLVAAAAVSATQTVGDQGGQDDDRIGVCHATGSDEEPFVFLVVKKDGFEHGHHRHHDGDFFVTDLARGCVSDDPVLPPAQPGNGTTPPGNATPEEPAEGPATNTTPEPSAGEPAGNGTPESPPADDAPASPPANGTAGPAGPAANETGNGTGNETPAAPAGDAAVRQEAVQDDFAVTLTLRVRSAGPGLAQDVTLTDNVPDVRRTWQLSGPDAAACVFDVRSLSCWFGDLAPGEERVVVLGSYTDRMPCGWALTNTASVSATGDAEPRDDASSASIAARAC